MFYVTKKLEISASHCLDLPYKSQCENFHGHNWIITITLSATKVNPYGMVLDFQIIKDKIKSQLDHKNLNDVLLVNPTAENIAFWIGNQIKEIDGYGKEFHFHSCEVQESEGNSAKYVEIFRR
jgi:6-pyruvoyltetrahydropterin/6-carboxytetrahydropterin synthase